MKIRFKECYDYDVVGSSLYTKKLLDYYQSIGGKAALAKISKGKYYFKGYLIINKDLVDPKIVPKGGMKQGDSWFVVKKEYYEKGKRAGTSKKSLEEAMLYIILKTKASTQRKPQMHDTYREAPLNSTKLRITSEKKYLMKTDMMDLED